MYVIIKKFDVFIDEAFTGAINVKIVIINTFIDIVILLWQTEN